jgi:hypothetical protein
MIIIIIIMYFIQRLSWFFPIFSRFRLRHSNQFPSYSVSLTLQPHFPILHIIGLYKYIEERELYTW